MKKKLNALIKLILRLLYTWKKTNYIIPSFNDENAEWLIFAPNYFKLRSLVSDDHQLIMSTYFNLFKENQSVTIYTKWDIGKFSNKKILLFNRNLNRAFKFTDHTAVIRFIADNLYKQNNQVFPNFHEASLWENKAYMHKVFEERNIRTPKSIIVDLKNPDFNILKTLSYPILVKEEHSCSSIGIHKVDSYDDLKRLFSSEVLRYKNQRVICQDLLNIRKDLRVILVGEKIVLHYWRINTSYEWKPTSTSYGSLVDFDNFPERWRNWIIENFKRLDMKTGAFDIAWQNDDINTEPYILEVSPFYQPNPRPLSKLKTSYGEWKKSISLRNSYDFAFVNVMFDIQKEMVKELIKSFGIVGVTEI